MQNRCWKKVCKNDEKWSQNEPKISPKSEKCRKKGMPKMVLKFEAEKIKQIICQSTLVGPRVDFGAHGGGILYQNSAQEPSEREPEKSEKQSLARQLNLASFVPGKVFSCKPFIDSCSHSKETRILFFSFEINFNIF